MGVKLTWQVPDTESDFDTVYVYRADSEDGSYAEVTNQTITDNTYYDMDGDSTKWYKIRFYDSVNVIWSSYSDALQGGYWASYCSVDDVRELCSISSSITDIEIFKLTRAASLELNHDIQVHVDREKVGWIDSVKTNDVDGTNTVFYSRNYPIGDRDNDFVVSVSDVIVYKRRLVTGTMTETELTVSSIDQANGKITLSAAPESDSEIFLCYVHTPREYPIDPVHEMIRKATAYLAGYLVNHRSDPNKFAVRVTLDRLTIVRQADSVKHDHNKYIDLINQITGGDIEVTEEAAVV